ncbi:hypothetical protein PVAND_003380 [Polypedilum vanderplanki]|uniref:DNA replication ATP-dependent helicase/nuclease n=1 Tax=Polypedilum vanderplanki TaxID=319348 RepID=A0A9J6BUD0_POLVA|nr:hypothetical protein PVAND_003380 [Polypedilum vanderplanki]
MEKRTISIVESPKSESDKNIKKIKISLSPHKNGATENNGNLLNTAVLNNDIDDSWFYNDDDPYLKELLEKANEKIEKLNLSNHKRCSVQAIEINNKAFEKILYLQEKKTKLTGKCCLKGIWFDTEISQGDVVSVKGIWNEDRKMYLVTNEGGIVVIFPDHLVSGTTVVGSLFCARKSILSEKFRGIDDGKDSIIMHIGSIVHEILQSALKENSTSLNDIKKITNKKLSNPYIMQLLYSCEIKLKDLQTQIDPFIGRIHEFMQEYIEGNSSKKKSNTDDNHKLFKGRIGEVIDIEENIWSPNLGLKGKIDATVLVYEPNDFSNSSSKLMPMEVKTGRASFSLEHKGQLLIYQMMMQDMGKQIDSGLLLYIREGIMSEIHPKRIEQSGLISMRNRLVKYMNADIITRDKIINLPEPITHHSACGNCPYNTLCCAFLKKEPNYVLKPNHPLVKIQESHTNHLTDEHLNYFLHWCNLIILENNEIQKSIKLKHIWTKTAEERAMKGKDTLANLILKDLVMPQHDEYIHTLGTLDDSTNFTTKNFNVGDYLIVSTDKRCSITAGRVVNVDSNRISLSLPKDLNHQCTSEKFHLDKFESQSQSVFNFTNIGVLLDNDNERKINQLRSIIIDKEPAVFSNTLPKSIQQNLDQTLIKMNSVQRMAVLKALTCENYMLIRGLPGSGKSQTLVNLIHLLKIMNKTILITSHTNSAVDNILLRLKERGITFLRLGSISRIHHSLREYCETKLVENCKSVEELENLYNSYQIVAMTCLGATHAMLSKRRFDFCLVDEATQIYQPTVIRPLLSADKFILVGDPEQLAPLVRSNDARLLGANESLFERLNSKESTFVLGLQYRMNKTITKLANNLTYNGELKCADEIIEKAVMEVPDMNKLKEKLSTDKWLAKVLTPHLDQACALINTGDVYEMARNYGESLKNKDGSQESQNEKSRLYINYCEIAIVTYIVDLLMECGVKGESIGIIAPYRDQVEILKNVFESNHSVEVNTVDQYQGRDKKIIIYSCTLSEITTDKPKTSSEIEILEDRRRLTVAITRAKHKLIMIGDVNCLNKYTPFRDLFKHMSSISKVQIQDEKFGFSWNVILDKLRVKLI